MTIYAISYDIVTIILCIILFVVYKGKYNGIAYIYKNGYFILLSTLFASVSHVVLYLFERDANVMGNASMYVCYSVFAVLMCMLLALYSLYVFSYSGIKLSIEKVYGYLAFVPTIVIAILMLTSPITHLMFYFDKNGAEVNGVAHPLLYFVMLYYAVMWIAVALKFRKYIEKEKRNFIYLLATVCWGLSFAIYMKAYISLIPFVSCLCIMVVLYSIQSPDEMFDSTNALHPMYLYKAVRRGYGINNNYSLLFINIKNKEALEESYDSIDVDKLFKNVTEYLLSHDKRSSVYRLESDVYVLSIRITEKEKVYELRDAIVARMQQDWHCGDINTKLIICSVLAFVPEDIESYEEFKKFIRLLARAKIPAGINTDAKEFKIHDKEAEILDAVKRATENNGFQVYYQPIYSTDKKRIVAAEALIRLIDDKIGFISPEVFIPLAEREGYILEIGRFVFEEVCRFYSSNNLKKSGIDYIEVNLSAIQCMQDELASEFMEIMNQYGLTSDQINFEITETSALASNSVVSLNMNRFVDNGVDLSLDDYGTGYSNISYLYHLPFSFVKIDKSILWSSDKNEKANITLSNIFGMAKKLNMRVVVEGVETEAHIKKLLDMNCDYFQGYYFSKPIPGNDFVSYVENFVLPEVCR